MYSYQDLRPRIFTEAGTEMLLKIRDRVNKLLEVAGAVREQEAISDCTGDSWEMLACMDYLVERGEIKRVYDKGARQHNVYTR